MITGTGQVKVLTEEEVSKITSLEQDSVESNDHVLVVSERRAHRLDQDLPVDIVEVGSYGSTAQVPNGLTIPAQRSVSSYLLHADNVKGTGTQINRGTVTFDSEILGIIIRDRPLLDSDDVVGLEGVQYRKLTDGLRGLELTGSQDTIELMDDRRTIRFKFRFRSEMDEVRIVTRSGSDCSFPPLGMSHNRDEAICRIQTEVLPSIARDEPVYGFAAQELMVRGTEVFESMAGQRRGRPKAHMVVGEESFFFFLDPRTSQKYGHAVFYATVSASTGETNVVPAASPPSVAGAVYYASLIEKITSPDRFWPILDLPTALSSTSVASVSSVRSNSTSMPDCLRRAVIVAGGPEPTMVNDAAEVQAFFREHGFDVLAVTPTPNTRDVLRTTVFGARDAIANKSKGLGDCDLMVLYFTAHGVKAANPGGLSWSGGKSQQEYESWYFDGVDQTIGRDGRLERLPGIRKILEGQTAEYVHVVVDACWSGRLLANLDGVRGGKPFRPRPGQTIRVTTSAGSTVDQESQGGNLNEAEQILYAITGWHGETSLFTRLLLKELMKADIDPDGDGASIQEYAAAVELAFPNAAFLTRFYNDPQQPVWRVYQGEPRGRGRD